MHQRYHIRKVLKIETHKFEPQGVTGFALLAESHLSIHTWPEKGVAVCDIFTCGDQIAKNWQNPQIQNLN